MSPEVPVYSKNFEAMFNGYQVPASTREVRRVPGQVLRPVPVPLTFHFNYSGGRPFPPSLLVFEPSLFSGGGRARNSAREVPAGTTYPTTKPAGRDPKASTAGSPPLALQSRNPATTHAREKVESSLAEASLASAVISRARSQSGRVQDPPRVPS